MADREKLIELLKNIPQVNHAQAAVEGLDYVFGCAADHLIANGVTVRERGRWEDKHEIKSFRHTNIPVVQCSECEVYFCDIINNHHYMYHFCPNCGADMRGEEDGK